MKNAILKIYSKKFCLKINQKIFSKDYIEVYNSFLDPILKEYSSNMKNVSIPLSVSLHTPI